MKRLVVLLALFAVACSTRPDAGGSLTAPSPASSALTIPGASANWDRTQLGRALITVPVPTVGTFFIFRVTAAGQIDYSHACYTLPAGTSVVTVKVNEACGDTYQRDFVAGICALAGENVTMSDIRNLPILGDEIWKVETKCAVPATPPAPPVPPVVPPPPPPPAPPVKPPVGCKGVTAAHYGCK